MKYNDFNQTFEKNGTFKYSMDKGLITFTTAWTTFRKILCNSITSKFMCE